MSPNAAIDPRPGSQPFAEVRAAKVSPRRFQHRTPHSRAVLSSDLNPQLALWATDMPPATPAAHTKIYVPRKRNSTEPGQLQPQRATYASPGQRPGFTRSNPLAPTGRPKKPPD